MGLLTRRKMLAVLGGGAAGMVVARGVSAAPASHTLWMLNPDWGSPMTTSTGSDTKSRCRGAACHKAAPHRFFLSEADALAGRLHACCLAQPVPVSVCVDLNALMPFYKARHGGIDGRCPELPDEVKSALYQREVCAAAQVDEVLPVAGSDTSGVVSVAAALTVAGVAAAAAAHRGNAVPAD